ncbi:MAG: imidazole glycerol phosphate synthase subunit HisH [Zoogloeaceae bacterium]|jgi:glutamine amidotransferase|nr:imidazole glycerol phosphate synthase subunit HisH [Zoogloeaceae bacterium]
MSVVIIDYGMGNLRSVEQALKAVAVGEDVRVSADPAEVAKAGRVVFPGQGAMPDCMAELSRRHLREAVLAAAAEKPFLGICIGLQMLFQHSEEGDAEGLGIFPGEVRRFVEERCLAPDGSRLKVPHMGWNQVWRTKKAPEHPLWAGIADGARFYFVHSYHVVPRDETLIAGRCEYGQTFTCAVERDNIFAVQFHPEKSAGDGLRLLANFMRWNP